MEYLYDKKIKARRSALWFKVCLIILCSFIYFWTANLIFLILYRFAEFGFTTRNTQSVYNFLLQIKDSPMFVFVDYSYWLNRFLHAETYSWFLFVPLCVPLLFLFIIFNSYMRNPHSFNLWYRFHNHFATLHDVLKMKILGGSLMSLGKFEGKSLGVNKPAALFGLGALELGKTSSVAIPSILESNNASIVAIDIKGSLAAHTSGHRADIGTVFYFDWNLIDNPKKSEYWPRWNPLSRNDLPKNIDKRISYLKCLAKHLYPKNQDVFDDELYFQIVECLLNFFVCKIEQAKANDYFLSLLLDKGTLDKEDTDILLSYYNSMLEQYAKSAIQSLETSTMNSDNYFPIGSWDGIPMAWKGKDLCLPMIADCLFQNAEFILGNSKSGGWKSFLQVFIDESSLFGYNYSFLTTIEILQDLDEKTLSVLFQNVLDAFSIFKKANIRERTSSSDYSLKLARGMSADDGKWHLTTTYIVVNSEDSVFMTRMFVDLLIERNLEKHKSAYRNPLLFVMDDWEYLPLFSSLKKGINLGCRTNVAFLLLSEELKKLSEIYGKANLEEIIGGCTYKLLFAEDNITLSKQFRELALYGMKSVQIPAVETGAFTKVQQGIADAHYYRKIADDLISLHGNKKINKGEIVLLVEGFYNLPVKVDAKYFLQDVRLKTLAEKNPVYVLCENFYNKRKITEDELPSQEVYENEINLTVTPEDFHSDASSVKEDNLDNALPFQENDENSTNGEETLDSQDNWWLDDKAFTIKAEDESKKL